MLANFKVRSIILFALILCTFTQVCWAVDWKYVATTMNGDLNYIDTDSLTFDNTNYSFNFWFKTIYKKPQIWGNKAATSSLSNDTLYCQTGTMMGSEIIDYDESGNLIYRSNNPETPSKVVPGSVGDQIHFALCFCKITSSKILGCQNPLHAAILILNGWQQIDKQDTN